MRTGNDPAALEAADARIRELEARLEESEDTLAAIRRGDFDAVVVEGPNQERLVYTLENADQPYRVLIEQIQEGAFTLSADGTLLYGNPRVAAMLVLSPDQLIGRPLHDFIDERERPALRRLLAEADGNGTARGEICLRPATDVPLPAHLSLSRLQRGDGMALLCGVLTDLTEQRRHLHDLAQANARLKQHGEERERIEEALRQSQKMEAIGQLTGGIAHDFNNLLTIIRSSVDFLRRPELKAERKQRYLDAVSDTVDRAARLTGQLLAFARRQSLTPEVFDVADKLRGVVEMLDTITGSRVRILSQLATGTCSIRADVSQFETALVNMAVNARDAMDNEGTLTLRLQCGVPMPAIRGHAGSAGVFAAVSVTDTGTGIAPEQIGRIFEPFFTTKEVGKGTGLGLSQVFGFAKQSGGDVDVDSEIGRGTTFTLYLPQVEIAAPEPVRVEVADPSPIGQGQRVLVVEDNLEVGRFCTQILEDLGYATAWAVNAEEALDLLGADGAGFRAVFSDVVMPGMGGLELARRLRGRLPRLPVVLTSGYSHVLAREDDHGFELLHKPYSAEQIARVLSRALGEASEIAGGSRDLAQEIAPEIAATVLDGLADRERLAALEAYGILGTEPEPGFDDIVKLARSLCAAPVALISFVAGDRQWFKARSGVELRETDLDRSICVHALGRRDLLVIPDLTRDDRTRDNPLVIDAPGLRFYAGAPLLTPGGETLGTLCVIDTIARPAGLSSEQAECLQILAGQVMVQLELRRAQSGRRAPIRGPVPAEPEVP